MNDIDSQVEYDDQPHPELEPAPPSQRGNIFTSLLKRFWPLLLILSVAAWFFEPWTTGAPSAFASGLTLQEASVRAQSENKVVVAVVISRWCASCQVYKRTTLASSEVKSWIGEHAVPVFLVWEDEEEQVDSLGVFGVPTTFVLDDNGTVLASHAGAMTPGSLIDLLNTGLENRSGI